MFGKAQWEGGDKKFVNLKLVSVVWPCEESDAPKFVLLWDDFRETDKSENQISGKLTKLIGTHTPAKGRMGDIFWFKAFLEDGDEILVVESTITNASKDMLNSLIPNIRKELKINVFLNKNQYPSSSVKENWKWVETYLPYNEIDNEKLFQWINVDEALPAQEDNSGDINPEDIPF